MTISIQVAVILGIIASLSLVLNAVLIYYTRISILKFASVSEGIVSLKNSVEDFVRHLQFVYELEMYYGDETLKGLIEHARSLSESLNDYDEFYDLFDFEEEEMEAEEIEEEVDGTQTQEG